MAAIVSVEDLRKVYATGFEALKGVSLEIAEGEILAMLGPNGAGKTTLISTICGITVPTSGRITVGGHDVLADYRAALVKNPSPSDRKDIESALERLGATP